MRVTTKGRYALRAVLALAAMGKNGEMVSINRLSAEEDISSVFLEQIFFNLKKAGLVRSSRGLGGGFTFIRPLDSLTVKEILDASGEELTLRPCDRHDTECDRMGYCLSHTVFATLTDKVNEYLGSITLQKVLESEEFRPAAAHS